MILLQHVRIGMAMVFCSLIIMCQAQADSPEQNRTTGTATAQVEGTGDTAANERDPKTWVGKQLTFLPINKEYHEQKYSDFRVLHPNGSKRDKKIETKGGNPEYRVFVGKSVTVVEVFQVPQHPRHYAFLFHEETTGASIVTASDLWLSDMALTDDLQTARDRWLNKTVYAKTTMLYQYDAKHGEEKLMEFDPVRFGDKLTVSDVFWGTDEYAPICIMVRTKDGIEGYYTASESDSPPSIYGTHPNRSYDLRFFAADPRTLPGWGDNIVDNIADRRAAIGMSSEQVKLALGSPLRTNTDTDATGTFEQWVYGNTYVYLKNGRCVDIQRSSGF